MNPELQTRSLTNMKSSLLVLLALGSPLCAQDPNPFVKKGDTAKTEAPPGDSFVAVVEHILVPPDNIAEWIRNNSITEDSDGLRAVVQQWIEEGKATLEHTHLATGVAARRTDAGSIVELIYPTEYEPSGGGVWPLATSFETRNTGISVDFDAATFREGPRLSVSVDHVTYTGSRAWDMLSNRTRHADDIFMPGFRSVRAGWGSFRPFGDARLNPFAETSVPETIPPSVPAPAPLPGGKYKLLARADPNPTERQQGGATRLVFLRGDFVPPVKSEVVSLPLRHLAYELLEVRHANFSAWQRSRTPAEIPTGAWGAVEGMRKAGEVTPISCGDGLAQGNAEWLLENICEEIYPTEWAPTYEKTVLRRWQSAHRQKEDGKFTEGLGTFELQRLEANPGINGASLPTSFETRNTGMTLTLKPFRDESGLLVNLSAQYVVRLGDTICRRIEDQGEWIQDITMPLFASNLFTTTCRITPDKWTLVGSGSRFTGLGKSDPGSCLLLFIKVE